MLLPAGAEIRVDSGVSDGIEVGVHYDPLLAKVIVHGADRPTALKRMKEAISETAFLGLTTNIEFLQDLLRHPQVQAGRMDTHFVESEFANWSPKGDLPSEVLLAAALIELQGENGQEETSSETDPYSPWGRGDSFRIGGG